MQFKYRDLYQNRHLLIADNNYYLPNLGKCSLNKMLRAKSMKMFYKFINIRDIFHSCQLECSIKDSDIIFDNNISKNIIRVYNNNLGYSLFDLFHDRYIISNYYDQILLLDDYAIINMHDGHQVYYLRDREVVNNYPEYLSDVVDKRLNIYSCSNNDHIIICQAGNDHFNIKFERNYDDIKYYYDNRTFLCRDYKERMSYLINHKGNILFESDRIYHRINEYHRFKKNYKYGLIDSVGNIVEKAEYKQISNVNKLGRYNKWQLVKCEVD